MNNQLCERMRTHYPLGTRVQLLRMDDPYAPVPSGTRGTVTHVADMGQLQMRWVIGAGKSHCGSGSGAGGRTDDAGSTGL